MNVFKGIMMGAVATAVVVLARREMRSRTRRDAEADVRSRRGESSPYRGVVEETLKQQTGSDTPMVRAFEQALEEEHRLERQLARETGLRI